MNKLKPSHFRGLPVERHKWISTVPEYKQNYFNKDGFATGSLVNADEGRTYICSFMAVLGNNMINNAHATAIEVDPKTVGCFTGKFDVKSNPVFEGDIISGQNLKYGKVRWNQNDACFEVVADFLTGEALTFPLFGFNTRSLTIIGNIHMGGEFYAQLLERFK